MKPISIGAMALAIVFAHVAIADESTAVSQTESYAASGTAGEPIAKKHKKKLAKKAKKAKLKKQKKEAAEAPVVEPVSEPMATPPAEAPQSSLDQSQDKIATTAAAIDTSKGDATPAQASTATSGTKLKDKMALSYIMQAVGPRYDKLDGKDGPGAAVQLRQYGTLGYKFNSQVKLSATQYWTNEIRGKSEGKRNLNWHDPYVTLNHANLWESKANGTNLSAYIRYYVPVSHDSADNVGKEYDTKNGMFRAKIDPTKTFLDGALTLSGLTFVYLPLQGAEPSSESQIQNTLIVWTYPKVQYQVSSKFAPYVAYSNVMEQYRRNKAVDGNRHWKKFNTGQNIELGFDWNPTASLTINPYTEFGVGNRWVLKEGTLGVIAEWVLL